MTDVDSGFGSQFYASCPGCFICIAAQHPSILLLASQKMLHMGCQIWSGHVLHYPFCVVSTNLNHTYIITSCVPSLPCFPHLHTECTTLSSNNLLPRQANVSKASRASPPPRVSPRMVAVKRFNEMMVYSPQHLIFRYIQVSYGYYNLSVIPPQLKFS